MVKIYSDDPNVPYKTTSIGALHTKAKVDGLLARWGVKDSAWRWDPDRNEVFVEFKFTEVIDGITVSPVIRVDAPVIWNHKTRHKAEEINWNVSMRVMFWFIKSHMEAAYLTQSSRTAAFLPYISTGPEGTPLAKVIIANLERIQNMPALPNLQAEGES